jgi:archaeal flagellin FlaB
LKSKVAREYTILLYLVSGNVYVSDSALDLVQKFKLGNSASSGVVTSSSALSGVNEQIKLEVKPPEGAVLIIARTMPPALADGVYYPVY